MNTNLGKKAKKNLKNIFFKLTNNVALEKLWEI